MREIKFRAWDKKVKKMTEPNVQCSFNLETYPINDLFSKHSDNFIWLQYTGLKDKNKKEIYSGDIVKHKHFGHSYIGWISWDEKDCMFIVETKAAQRLVLMQRMEIIGNIYENPELIK